MASTSALTLRGGLSARAAELAKTTRKLTAAERRLKGVPQEIREAQLFTSLVGVGAAFALGTFERYGKAPTLEGVDPALLYGAGLAVAGELTHNLNGNVSEWLRSAGGGLLAASFRQIARSGSVAPVTPTVSGYGETDPFAAGYSVFDDGDDDDGPDQGQL